ERDSLFVAYRPNGRGAHGQRGLRARSEEHTSELQSLTNIVCRLLLEKKIFGRVRAHWRPLEKETARSDAAAPPEFPRFLSMKLRPAGHDVRIFFFIVTVTAEVPPLSLRAALPI